MPAVNRTFWTDVPGHTTEPELGDARFLELAALRFRTSRYDNSRSGPRYSYGFRTFYMAKGKPSYKRVLNRLGN